MQEINNENSQYKCEDVDRPFNPGKSDYDFKKQWPHPYGPKWQGGFGPKWPGGYGPYFPGGYGPYCQGGYCPGTFGGSYNWPLLLLALNSLRPRDILRYMDEMEGMDL